MNQTCLPQSKRSPFADRCVAPLGITAAICTHNGAARLPATLRRLGLQSVPTEIPWEVVLIDNASTDGTADVARACWPAAVRPQLRVVSEDRLGLSYARERALAEATHPVVVFVDDDNWLGPDWIRIVSNLMMIHPEVGACAGIVKPVFETQPPPWAIDFMQWPRLAASAATDCRGDVTDTFGWLIGAGLSIRASAYRQLRDAGFRHLTVDRQGKELTGGGDMELSYALRMAGWRLWFEPTLNLEHFIPSRRLTWSYTCALAYGSGFSEVELDFYRVLLEGSDSGKFSQLSIRFWQVFDILRYFVKDLVCRPRKGIRRAKPQFTGDVDVLRIYGYLGRLDGLLRSIKSYWVNQQSVSRLATRLNHKT